MSDPSLVQISFKIKPEMPKDMKKYILDAFTDYYKYYPNKQPSHEEYLQLMEKYPEICAMHRNDAYHNVDFQTCNLSEYDLYDLDTLEILHDNGHWLDENGNEILSIMLWSWMEIIDGIKFYHTDMVALNPDNDSIRMYDVEKLDTKFKIVNKEDPYYYKYGASSVMYEDKLPNSQKIEKIKKINITANCKK